MANNKLREALVCAIQALDIAARNTRGETGMVVGSCYSVAARKCRAALAEPVRNCDVIGNTGRALAVHGFPTKSKPWGEGEWLKLIDWLFAPYEEGGAK